MPHPNSLLSLLAAGGGGSSDDANNNNKNSGDSILATTRQQIRRIKSLERSNAAKDRRITDLEDEINALRAARLQQNNMHEIQVRQLRQQKNMAQDRANCLQADFDNKLSLAQYASAVKRSTSDNAEYTDSSYVLRLQAQLAKSMHQAAMAQKQAKIISEHCRTIVNDVNAELAEVMENKTKTELKLRNHIASITKENTELALAAVNQSSGETVDLPHERGEVATTSTGTSSSSSHSDFDNFKRLVNRMSHTTPITDADNNDQDNNNIHNECDKDDDKSHFTSSTMSSEQEEDLVQTELYYDHVRDDVQEYLEDSNKADTSMNEACIPRTIVVRRCSNDDEGSSSPTLLPSSSPTVADQAAGISSTSTRTTSQPNNQNKKKAEKIMVDSLSKDLEVSGVSVGPPKESMVVPLNDVADREGSKI